MTDGRTSARRTIFRFLPWRRTTWTGGIAAAVLLSAAIATMGERGLPPQEGIANFGRIGDRLFRGAQPDGAGVKSLQRLGVKLIINLRMPGDALKTEEPEALA